MADPTPTPTPKEDPTFHTDTLRRYLKSKFAGFDIDTLMKHFLGAVDERIKNGPDKLSDKPVAKPTQGGAGIATGFFSQPTAPTVDKPKVS